MTHEEAIKRLEEKCENFLLGFAMAKQYKTIQLKDIKDSYEAGAMTALALMEGLEL